MAEMIEKNEAVEKTEQTMTYEERDALREQYLEGWKEAYAQGNEDMKAYYSAKMEQVAPHWNEECAEWNEEFQKRMKAKMEEGEAFQDELREWKAVHFAPNYLGGVSSSVYRYDAMKEYEKNGASARFIELVDNAAEAALREKYPGIFK